MRKIQYLSKGKGLVVKKANTFTYVFVKIIHFYFKYLTIL
jgi:hypothetical protein